MRSKVNGQGIEMILLVISIILFIFSPKDYSFRYCLYCFIIFIASASLLLVNNVRVYRTFFIFEVLFTMSFFFVNYAYPIFIYEIDPYFSLFTRSFNEHIISKSTAVATVGFVAYSVGQYKIGNAPITLKGRNNFALIPLNGIDLSILFVLFVLFLYSSLSALRQGYSQSGSIGAGFFYIFSLFYIYKYFAYSIGKSSKFCIYSFFSLLVAYIVLSLVLGNRGEPMYLCMALFYCYHVFAKKIAGPKVLVILLTGLFVFYFVGKTRISLNQLGMTSRSERISGLQAEDNMLRYANELIINNRSSFVLIDYADNNGFSYGKTWGQQFFSIIPFGQSFALKVLSIPSKDFSTTNLTTYIEFGNDDPDAFGLGTNLIGDIYVSFGMVGIIILMFLFGKTVRIVHDKSIRTYSYYQMFYIILFALSVYYNRASLFSPLQMLAWTYVLCVLNRKSSVSKQRNMYNKKIHIV